LFGTANGDNLLFSLFLFGLSCHNVVEVIHVVIHQLGSAVPRKQTPNPFTCDICAVHCSSQAVSCFIMVYFQLSFDGQMVSVVELNLQPLLHVVSVR
jgi:hypothetical protein